MDIEEVKRDKVRQRIIEILDEIVTLVQTGTMLFRHTGKGLENTKTTAEYAQEICQLESKPDERYVNCPFCGESGFDLTGLKSHLRRWCETYKNTGEFCL